jgi:retron-type reverse transcriptase
MSRPFLTEAIMSVVSTPARHQRMPVDFRALQSVKHLATVASVRQEVLHEFLATPDRYLQRVSIPRHDSSRAPREAWSVANAEVKSFLGRLRLEFDAFLRSAFGDRYPHPCVHGYIGGYSALTNAKVHAGHRTLLHVDVRDFFPSVRTDTVRDALLRLGLKSTGAELLAKVVTRENSLPLGYPTSPLFSNVVLLDVDRRLAEMATVVGATYSRYADDITFSGDGKLPRRTEVGDVLRTVGLEIHPTKSRERKRGQALYVTGYSVSDTVARAPRPLKRRLRQELHFIGKYGLADHLQHLGRGSVAKEYDRIIGQIEHVRHVEPTVGDDLLAAWFARDEKLDGTITRSTTARATPVTLLFDDSGFKFFGTEYRALGAVILRDHEAVAARLRELADDFLLNPIMPEHARDHVRTKGLHFNQLPPDFRRDAIALAANVPARAHIVFDKAAGSKKAQLGEFLRAALKWRLESCAGKLLTVVFEEGEYIKKADAVTIVKSAFDSLSEERRPLRIEGVRVEGKLSEPCVALPDIFLGAWQQFACGHEPERKRSRDRDELLFRTLQPRIGTIFQPSAGALFTSRKPFDGLAPPAPDPVPAAV